jgi:hypothetical protein
MEVYMIDCLREICKPLLKLDFTAHWHNGVPLGIWTQFHDRITRSALEFHSAHNS